MKLDWARTTRVGHATCVHSCRKERWAFSASERTITSRSKRGHHQPSRSSSPVAPARTDRSAAEENSLAQVQRLFDINVFGVMRMTKAVLPFMRVRGSGRVINISSVLGFLPAPNMATYSASKHALEGYTESLDHEIREHGVRALVVQPGGTRSSFEANTVEPDMPMQIYAEQRRIADRLALAVNEEGDDPATVAKAIVVAATDAKPKVRYAAGRSARLLSAAHRILPAGVFDGQIRKTNKLAG
ncbi:SDR family NAD(P)-dependent oxidoreductase [Streptomyces sp. NPDC058678]|uniref:SDR family NAD(P)-dependent oxidoreductase n=1 Tax=Streptomyces sp. NPDC058678 TaxID=3346595 RepID=UPI003647D2B4